MDAATAENTTGTVQTQTRIGRAVRQRIDREAAFQLAMQNERYVRSLAGKVKKTHLVESILSADDLFQHGMMAAVEAAYLWDESINQDYWSYAKHRVRGEMLDQLRRANHIHRKTGLPRLSRDRTRSFFLDDLENLQSAQPNREEFADLLKWVGACVPGDVRTMMSQYFFDGLTMREIGKLHGCSESRVSQLFTSELEWIRQRCRLLGIEPCDLFN